MSTGSASALLLLTSFILQLAATTSAIGVNYGTVGDNLPPPAQVANFIKTQTIINRIKIFDANPEILRAFANTNISVTVSAANGEISALTELNTSRQWVAANIAPFHPQTNIIRVVVGNEVLQSAVKDWIDNLLPAMKSLHQALVEAGFKKIKVSTPHTLGFLEASDPPSQGRFKVGYDKQIIAPMLQFLRETKSAFMINAYPYFTYSPEISNYTLFKSKQGVYDKNTGLTYYNMFDAMLDAVYSAMKKLGYADVPLAVAETGWASVGDPPSSVENAHVYNWNLINHVSSLRGTPLMPTRKFETYVFALFNEDLKTGPISEKNFGLFKPDFTPVYDAGIMRTQPKLGQGAPTPVHGSPTPIQGKKYCIPKPDAGEAVLQSNIDYACNHGADCKPIQPGGACFKPNTIRSHAAFAMNSYYQVNDQIESSCDFAGSGVTTISNPSYGSCVFVTSPIQALPTPVQGPPTPAQAPTPMQGPPTPAQGPPPSVQGNIYCISKPEAGDSVLQANIEYACSNGADCRPIQPDGACFKPNTVRSHAAFVMNSYFQVNDQTESSCNFSGTGVTTTSNPSYGSCVFPISSAQARPTPAQAPPTPVQGPLTPVHVSPAPRQGPPASVQGNIYCIPKPEAGDNVLQANIEYACSNGADCGPIQPGGACFEPNTVRSHAAFAMNSYFQVNAQDESSCDFNGTGVTTTKNPGHDSCVFSISPVQAPPTPAQAPPSPVQGPITPVQAPPAPVQGPPTPVQGNIYCIPKAEASDSALQANIEFACSNGADCNPIQPGGSCFEPNTVRSHAIFAMNSYYQANGKTESICDFAGTGVTTTKNPSYGSCVFSISPVQAPPTPVQGPQTPIQAPPAPVQGPPAPIQGNIYCIPKAEASDSALQANIEFACSNGADCSSIQPGGSCFEPNTVRSHAAFAMNSYFQVNGKTESICDFAGTGVTTTKNPSYGSCVFSISPVQGPLTPIQAPPAPVQGPPTPIQGNIYCIPKAEASDSALQANIEFACSNGADCSSIQPGGSCFEPNTIRSHAAIAMNSYFQVNGKTESICDFAGTGTTTTKNPSYGSCVFSISPIQAPSTPVQGPLTPIQAPPTPVQGNIYCIPKSEATDSALQANIEYACSNGADCNPIQPGGSCFEPDTVRSHAAFAMNSYFKVNGKTESICDFSGTGVTTTKNPSYSGCVY